MDSGWAVVVGALVGGVATMGGTFFQDWIQVWRQAKLDKPRKELLKKMLEGSHQWRKLETLANVTGLNLADAKRLLVEVGARGSETDGSLWGLISRNPLPAHDDVAGH
jgi:hypothetical protein